MFWQLIGQPDLAARPSQDESRGWEGQVTQTSVPGLLRARQSLSPFCSSSIQGRGNGYDTQVRGQDGKDWVVCGSRLFILLYFFVLTLEGLAATLWQTQVSGASSPCLLPPTISPPGSHHRPVLSPLREPS